MKKRLLSILCVLALCLTLLPATALAADGDKTIMLGTSGIKDPTPTTTDKGTYYTPSSYIYFGVNGSDPIKWRVLNDDTANDNSTPGVFLLSEYLLAGSVYFQEIHHNNEVEDFSTRTHKGSAPSDGDHTNCLIANAWQGSDAQAWCKAFASDSSNFSEAERSAMLGLEKTDSVENSIYELNWGESSLTAEDKMFFLSAWELANYVGDYDYAPGLMAQFADGGADYWWLRSPIAERSLIAGLVDSDGKAYYTNVKNANAVRPAFNLDLSSVLFTSAAVGGKSATGMDSGLTAVGAYDGSEWKLTLLDKDRNFAVTEKTVSGKPSDTITLKYTGATTGTNEYISVLLTDQQDNVLYYGRVVQATIEAAAEGEISLIIPDTLAEGTYTLNVFSEQYNGDYKTDYASAFAKVTLTVDETAPTLGNGSATRDSETDATVKFTSSEAGTCYYIAQDTEITLTNEQIAAQGTQQTCNAGENEAKLDNITTTTSAWYMAVVVKDAAGNVSDILSITIPAPTYIISAEPTQLNFESKADGYTEPPAAQTVTITNTGNQRVTVDLPASTNYTITAGEGFETTSAVLAPNGTATFTVQPVTGLGVGTYGETLSISGSNNTSAEVSLAFTVEPKSLEGAQVNVTGDYTYDGNEKKPSGSAVTVTLNDETLTEGSDYTLSYENNTDAGTATVTATGVGSYTGTATGNFTIAKATPAYTVPTGLTATYGSTLADVALPTGWDWDVPNTSVGDVGENPFSAAFTPDDAKNYNTVTENLTVTVSAKDISNAEITLGEALTYTGQEQTQQITSVTVDGLTVTYTVTDSTGTDAGDYTLTVTGTGNFTGEATQGWSIAKADYTGATGVSGSVLANWTNKVTLPVIPAGASYGDPSTDDDLTGLSITGNILSFTGGASITEGQKYEITVPVNGGKNYENYTITVTLAGTDKQVLTITGVTAQNGTYNGQAQTGYTGTPSAEGFTGDFTVTYNTADGKAPTNAGNYSVTIAIPDSDPQYVGSIVLEFTIAKKPLTVSAPSTSVYVGDSAPELALTYTGLVDGESVTPSEDPVFTITKSDGTVIALDEAVKTAGTYTITWSNADSTTFPDGANYAIQTETTGTLTVSPRSTGGSGVTTYLVDVEDAADGEVKSSHSRASQGTTVTLIVIPDEGYELASLTITKSSGEDVKFTDKGNGKFTFTMPSGNVTVEAVFTEITPAPLPFTDVAENAWYAEAVRYVYEHGLMTGTSATTFAPNATTSRSMIATILWRMAGSPVVNYAMDYADVAQGQWYSEAIRWAASEGIVGGYGNGLFGTNDPITREQLVTMLYRYAQAKGYDTTQGGMAIREYADFEQISGYAVEAMTWAVNTGIINGTSSTTLSPQGAATRAQVATILMRFIEGMA